jgi:phosphoribosylamine--glycine ligase
MNILIIGSGGREHALAIAIKASPLTKQLYVSPGNPGTAEIATNVDLPIDDHESVAAFCHAQRIGLVVVGPEAPLVAGIADSLEAAGVLVFGPSRLAAQLEGSKGFTKDLCKEAGIPTAAYERFSDVDAAKAYIRGRGAPIVVKADGLAAGKGVIVAQHLPEAEAAIDMIFGGAFGAAGAEVVVEDFLEGEEASFFALCDGERAIPFASAQDHKRVGEGDTGPNTGGMGAYSPAPIMSGEMVAQTMQDIIEPAVRRMRERGTPYRGVLFAGLMIGAKGPQLIEFNARFGDPETQVMLPRLDQDIVPLLLACARGGLPDAPVRLRDKTALTVVYAANGYPDAPERGSVIGSLDLASKVEGVTITHAGTKTDGGHLVANGGRVLNVTALADSVSEAREKAYQALAMIDWPGGFYRNDIGWRAVKRERGEE